MQARRPRGRPPHPDVLTPAEWRILDWLRHGLSLRQVAERRGTSRDAVKYHVANITAKLGVRGVAELRHWPGVPATSATRRREDTMPETALRLGPIAQVALHVRDIERAQRFYGDTLGLPHHFTFGDLAFYDMAGVRLYLQAVPEDRWRSGSIIYFLVGDIHAGQAELQGKGVHFTGAPHVIYTDPATGTEEWFAFFEDGEGNTLALLSRVTPGAS
jgi:DNA-binding CsgD family transcriptional regulator/catechol 2,3-dioxygenase-like lactoylglutathione lyase family enzyme